MKTFTWSDKLQHRGRIPRLVLWDKEQRHAVIWGGNSEPRRIAILSNSYVKNGKWSENKYELAVSENIIPIQMLCPWGGWGQTWNDIICGFEPIMECEFSSVNEFDRRVIAQQIANSLTEDGFTHAVRLAERNERVLLTLR